ncbi:MAG: hypothetical protein CMB99_02015 [Flavobacteriaceae bacterium]|nr:hypothetical protein [Flavobacteriaceae bacterium]|tara:strand:- start:47720 stop:48391 length:672 start_codon:yes stop_codon:yes gene_type:complete
MKSILKITFAVLILNVHLSYAQKQPFIGFWEVEKVSMGDRSMTPVAKWVKLHEDGSYESGNGWLKSIDGKWSYDEEKKYIESKDLLGIKDKLGGFTISFTADQMIWKRTEFGNEVRVQFKRITKLPMAPADYLEGVWISEGNTKEKIHFRWDRIVVFYDADYKRTTGYWHIHGHRSDITILPHTKSKSAESWRITVDKTTLNMTGISNSNKGVERKFKRTNVL